MHRYHFCVCLGNKDDILLLSHTFVTNIELQLSVSGIVLDFLTMLRIALALYSSLEQTHLLCLTTKKETSMYTRCCLHGLHQAILLKFPSECPSCLPSLLPTWYHSTHQLHLF